MTVSTTSRVAGPFSGDGVATALPFSFKVFAASELLVERVTTSGRTELALGTDYTVSLNGNQDVSPGGVVTLLVANPVGADTYVTSDVQETQLKELTSQSGYYPKTINDALDKITILSQQNRRSIGQSLRVSAGSELNPLPPTKGNEGKFVGIDAGGNPIFANGTGADAGLRTDLAATGGDALVRVLKPFTNAQSATQAEVNRQRLNFMDFVPSAQRQAMYDRTSTYDGSVALARAVAALGSDGGAIDLPDCRIRVDASALVNYAVWKPVLLNGSAATEIVSTHDGPVITDNTGNIRVQNIRFIGPGLSNINAVAIDTFMSQGGVQWCYFEGFRVAVDATGSSGGFIQRNQFTLCQEAIRCKHTNPAFGNALFVANNWIDFCTYAGWFEEMYGLILDNNLTEYNAVGWHMANVREFEMRPNWYEANTVDYEISGASSGVIDKYVHTVGGGAQNISWNADMRIMDNFKPSTCILTNTVDRAVAHNTNVNIAYDTEVTDPAGLHSSGTGEVVIKAPGTYRVSTEAEVQSFAAGTTNTVFARSMAVKNGTVMSADRKAMLVSQPTELGRTTTRKLAFGDSIRHQVYQNSGGSLNVKAGELTRFEVTQLSADY